MPVPLIKAAASARMNRVAILPANQPSTSKALSSSNRWLDLGIADRSCSLIEMRSMIGVVVSACAAVSVAQPDPTSVRSISTSNDGASTLSTLATLRSDDVVNSSDRIRSEVCGSTR